MKVSAFDFDLPERAIAQHPARPRDAARLLEVTPGMDPEWRDGRIADLPGLLAGGDLLVVNDTRVLPTRLAGRRGAARIEATLVARRGSGVWTAFARPGRRLGEGDVIAFAPDLAARVADKAADGSLTLAFDTDDAGLLAALERVGRMPLPPYIRRPRAPAPGTPDPDRTDYQTPFARRAGAVAAPTAGLHFTERLLAALAAAGIGRASVTLHVGPGTFLPVRAEDARNHAMHAEWGEVTAETARAVNETRARGGRVVAVGTTSLRLLESAADADGALRSFAGETDLFILPGYRFRAVDLLMTNFHLPRSTLFMLVAAFSGLERMKAAYAHAIRAGYRFYSYGDACLLHPAPDALARRGPGGSAGR